VLVCGLASFTTETTAKQIRPFAKLNQLFERPIGYAKNSGHGPVAQVHGQPVSGIEKPNVQYDSMQAEFGNAPLTSESALPTESLPLTLDQAIQLSLQHAPVLRSLGAQVVTNPLSARGIYDPAIEATDPIFGIEAALAQFDATLSASLNHANNDDVFNNSILGGGATEVVQDLTTANVSLDKTGATGTRYTVRSRTIYDNNNNVSSTFPSSYTSFWEAQARQPLLQGRGVDFNRIAGPNAAPGFRASTGVLLSRINQDISIAQFERSVNDHVNEVIRAYWELYFSYKQFETSKLARDGSLKTWSVVKARFENDLPGGEADKEAQAREQYYRFEDQVISSLNGSPRSGRSGVLQAEADLRRLIGMPQSDYRIIRPSETPSLARTVYQWESLVESALDKRPELRQQMWRIKQRELELLASRNFLLPRLDAVATYRNNGFGDQLVGGGGRFSSAAADMASGDHDEWELGLQFNMPVGFRQAHTGVRNGELKLIREQAVLDEQRKQILHDLGSAVRQIHQSYRSTENNMNRVIAAQEVVKSRLAAFEADAVNVDLLLDSVQRQAEAQTEFERAQIDLQLANEAVNFQSGQLLSAHAVHLGQSESSNVAGIDTHQRRNWLHRQMGRTGRVLQDYRF
jgi:outer membrane protein TolC